MRTVFTMFLSFLNLVVFSQTPMNWEQCAVYALENNLALKKQGLIHKAQLLNVNSAKSAFLPNINAQSNYNKYYGRSIDPETNDIVNRDFFSNSYGLSGSLTLFEGFSRINRLQFEKYNAYYTEAELEYQNNLTVFLILENYFNTLFYKGMLAISMEQVEVSIKELYKAQKMFDLGRSSHSDVIELEAQLAQDSLTAIQYEINWSLAINDLKQAMNYPLADELELVEIQVDELIIDKSEANPEIVLSQAKQNLPEIKMLEYNLKAAKKRLAQVSGGSLPSLSLSSSWSSGFYETTTDSEGVTVPFNEQIKGNAQKNIGLSLNIPIFTRLNNYTAIQRAKVNYDIVKTDYERQINEIEYEIQKNILELEAAQKEYTMASKNMEKQKLAFKTAEKKLEKGLINIIDYADVKNQYAQSQSEVLRTGIQLFLKYKTIQFYLTGEIL